MLRRLKPSARSVPISAVRLATDAPGSNKATASGPSPVEPEPGMDEIDPDADLTLDESGATATQLIAAELGAQLIGEDEH